MKLKMLFSLIVLVLVSSCASVYTPTANVLEMKNKMSRNQAIKVFKSAFIKPDQIRGFCQGNGVDGGGLSGQKWHLNSEHPKLVVTKSDISFNVQQVFVSYSSSGNIATQGAAGLTTTSTVQRVPIRKTIKLSDIEEITLHTESGAMTRRCYRPDGHTEVVVHLSSGFGHWFAMVLKNEDIERFVAAMMILVPHTEIKTS
ncbi:MAG: hypothetical protein ACN4GM_08245 [Gammaproteobacteria bacterium]